MWSNKNDTVLEGADIAMSIYHTEKRMEEVGIKIPFQLIFVKRGTIKDTFCIRGSHVKDMDGNLICRAIVPDKYFIRDSFGWAFRKNFELQMVYGMMSQRLNVLHIEEPIKYVHRSEDGVVLGESVRNRAAQVEVVDERKQLIGVHRSGFWKKHPIVDSEKKERFLFSLQRDKRNLLLGHRNFRYEVTSDSEEFMDPRLLLSWIYFSFVEPVA